MNFKRVYIYLLLVVFAHVSVAQSYVPEVNNDRVKIKPIVDVKAYTFHLSEVQILDDGCRPEVLTCD
jgi:hypothetical protein